MIGLTLLLFAVQPAAEPAPGKLVTTVAAEPVRTGDSTFRLMQSVNAVARSHDFHGELVLGEERTFLRFDLMSPLAPRLDRTWRWASVTKQVVATLVMQEVAAGRIDLDQPVATYLPTFRSANARTATVRHLLQHRAGLPNPDDTATAPDTFPAYLAPGYTGNRDPLTGYCAGPVKGRPGGHWAYNNCDYLVLGALLEKITGKSWQALVAERIARPAHLTTVGAFPTSAETTPGTVNGKAEPAIDLAAFGAAAGLYGTAGDLALFDAALLEGGLLPEAARAEMWDGKPELGFMSLGQWSFTAPLRGCAAPVRVIERRGAVGGVQVRNFLLPASAKSVVAFTDRGEFDFGEVWAGKGFSFELLSRHACGVAGG